MLGGRTSDLHRTRNSNFYEISQLQDEVMADRGFTFPPRNARKRAVQQITSKENKGNGKLRIFVEQAICRLKTFRLIKHKLPISLLSNEDAIVIVCAAICNIYKPLCKKVNVSFKWQYVVPENIHTHTMEGPRGRSSQQPRFKRESMKLDWEFQGGLGRFK